MPVQAFLPVENIDIKVGSKLELCVYIIITSEKIVKIFNKGHVVDEDDLIKLSSYEKDKIIILKNEYLELDSGAIKDLSLELRRTKKIDPKRSKDVVKKIFKSNNLDDIVEKADELIRSIIEIEQTDRGKLLQSFLDPSQSLDDEFFKHGIQVSTVAILIGLTQYKLDVENLADLALASFLHSAALELMVNPESKSRLSALLEGIDVANVVDKFSKTDIIEAINQHIYDGKVLTGDQREVFLNHFSILKKSLEGDRPYEVTDGVVEILNNFNYSQICSSSNSINASVSLKVLIVADHLVGQIQAKEDEAEPFKEALKELKETAKKYTGLVMLDHSIISELENL